MLKITAISAAPNTGTPGKTNTIFDPKIQEIVIRVVKAIIASGAIPSHMEDDAAIDVFLELYRAAGKFDPARCDFINYSRMVASRHAALIIRKYRAKNRVPFTSLDVPLDSRGHTLADFIESSSPSSEEPAAWRVAKVLRLMPAELRSVCHEIMAAKSLREVAKKRNMSFSWFYQKYMIPVRKSYISCEKKLREMEGF